MAIDNPPKPNIIYKTEQFYSKVSRIIEFI